MSMHYFNALLVSVLAAITAGTPAAGAAEATVAGEAVAVAQLDGRLVTRNEFEQKTAKKLFQARNEFFKAETQALKDYVDQLLVDKQAREEGLSEQELFDKHVVATLPADPSDESLRVYYEGLDVEKPFKEVRDQILNHLRQRRIERAKQAYLAELRQNAEIELLLTAPRASVSIDGSPVSGPADAPVLLVEFADYECPYCQQIQPQLERLRNDYEGRLAFVYKDMPLPNHANAQKAAEAAHCAGAQGKYWQLHDILAQSKQLELPHLKRLARSIGLDGESFDGCLDSGEKAPVVNASLEEAKSLGLEGTPSFFINGRFLSGALTYEELQAVVEEELVRQQARPSGEELAGR